MSPKRNIDIKLLPDGRVCIHWLVADEKGPIKLTGRQQQTSHGALQLGGYQGRIACNPLQNTVNPQVRNGIIYMCHFATELQNATCPKCLASEDALVGVSDQVLEGMQKIDAGNLAAAS